MNLLTSNAETLTMRRWKFYGGLFLITLSTLMLQLIQTRILSVVAWYHLAFFVISIAMFGLTAGAVYVYRRGDRFTEKTLSHDLAYNAALFAMAIPLSLAVQLTLWPALALSLTSVLVWVELAICLSIPFFFAGVVVSLALTRSPYPIGRVYGVDLLGAAAGCLGVLLVLNATDGPSAALWVAAAAGAGATLFSGTGIGNVPDTRSPLSSVLYRPGMISLILALCALMNGMTMHGIQPLFVKGRVETRGSALLLEEWNSFSRVVALAETQTKPALWGASPKLPSDWLVDQRRLEIDGLAGTQMFRFDGDPAKAGFLKYDITNLAYFLPNRKRAAVIGVGGGRDMLSAWVLGLREITGIEVNPIFNNLLTNEPEFSAYAGLNKLNGMQFVTDEARSWLARTDQTFDVIQMSMIDTWAATGAGAFTLSENALYTEEAWRIFIDRLSPNGVFTVSRWYATGEVNETGRMISLAMATLMNMAVTNPAQHLFLASTPKLATLVLSRSPFRSRDLDALQDAVDYYGYNVLLSPTSEPSSEMLRNIVTKSGRAELDRYTGSLDLDLTPPNDDRPFFFNQLPFNKPLQIMKLAKGSHPKGVLRGNLEAVATLQVILIVSIVLVLATIIFPLRAAAKDLGTRIVAGGTAYFVLIGIGFMSVEIGLLQRMTVILGHPIYSLSVVLFSLILTTGVGSMISDRLQLDGPFKFTIWSLLTGVYIVTIGLWLSRLFLNYESAQLLVRAGLCLSIIAPGGLLMGFGFPTGMRLLSAIDQKSTPWFWGINGAAGVLGSILAVATSIALGIHVTLIMGGVCYLLLSPAALAIGFRRTATPG